LIETPVERIPPFRDADAEPFEAVSALTGADGGAGDGDGEGGGAGVAGSVLRLVENIDMTRNSFGE
jgi:hypothetical protein